MMRKGWVIFLGLLIVAVGVMYGLNQSSKNRSDRSVTQNKIPKKQIAAQKQLPKGAKVNDWQLKLVNKQHPITTEMTFSKVTVDDKQMDIRIEKPLAAFREAAKQAGYATTLVSAYRSIDYQTKVYQNSITQNEANGMDKSAATKLTQSVIQTPGSSEHHTGLAVDLAGNDAIAKYPGLMAQMDEFKSQQWLIKHAPEFGFVLRYPKDMQSIKQTGIDYESWHFRYVGRTNAKYMTDHHLTLEAYVKQLQTVRK
ncbi:Serine-type D-Ala-D-Ala carboxypeptidase [Leuconostoc carnosum]|uniref:M15 family metallopeptidase n=1 Tax=Leuconostoc TaxID=1243 RepID=UPI000D51AFF8|nr:MULTISPECIES: M15 family metallopeptidase [Leuconostoc]KAA8326496.1 D-alanyl-D-alanine carboxypeptidase family protein [Leuconostoc carnosum]KAA8373556.1 D-alanyl-D-alanine carboxypeptidase family protein [Leuconostoc carnosum]MDV8935989.1 M15 family metallopeptidase [Leuconostoc sp.]SPO34219.1 Serine-type D-Ala-D-Ala carboxypeptidase [Leuconostoc carnosum]